MISSRILLWRIVIVSQSALGYAFSRGFWKNVGFVYFPVSHLLAAYAAPCPRNRLQSGRCNRFIAIFAASIAPAFHQFKSMSQIFPQLRVPIEQSHQQIALHRGLNLVKRIGRALNPQCALIALLHQQFIHLGAQMLLLFFIYNSLGHWFSLPTESKIQRSIGNSWADYVTFCFYKGKRLFTASHSYEYFTNCHDV